MMNNKVHIWIENNFSSADDYIRYFELDYSTDGDIDDPDYKICGFCKELGINGTMKILLVLYPEKIKKFL